jgi:hypothetical protein
MLVFTCAPRRRVRMPSWASWSVRKWYRCCTEVWRSRRKPSADWTCNGESSASQDTNQLVGGNDTRGGQRAAVIRTLRYWLTVSLLPCCCLSVSSADAPWNAYSLTVRQAFARFANEVSWTVAADCRLLASMAVRPALGSSAPLLLSLFPVSARQASANARRGQQTVAALTPSATPATGRPPSSTGAPHAHSGSGSGVGGGYYPPSASSTPAAAGGFGAASPLARTSPLFAHTPQAPSAHPSHVAGARTPQGGGQGPTGPPTGTAAHFPTSQGQTGQEAQSSAVDTASADQLTAHFVFIFLFVSPFCPDMW